MDFKIEIRPLATIEIIEAFDWYELQREALGIEFLNELEIFINTLRINPKTYSFYKESVRQGQINRFPYTVVYEIIDASVIIYSVFMARQNPGKKRIQ